MFKVFVGYDPREDIAWEVCRFSLTRHSKVPLGIHPLRQQALRELGLYNREVDGTASTEFSLTRFLTPYLSAHRGWTMFVDCDFLFTKDISELVDSLDPSKAVYVVKHDYIPRNAVKMDGKAQSTYPRKNWSSMMLFNCGHPDVAALTPNVINEASPAYLHRFGWVKNDEDIGELDRTWNFLVGEYQKPQSVPGAIHYTNGGPWFSEWRDVDYGDLWEDEKARFLASGLSAT